MADLYLSLGSNLGLRELNLQSAIELLIKNDITIKKISSIYETEPVGVIDQPLFLNLVCYAYTKLKPLEVLNTFKKVEVLLGRDINLRLAPRVIDVDLLLYDKLLINTPELIIPHPRMFERLFVIAPLDEIAPDILLSVFPQYQKENFINQNVQIWKGL